jgi:hypothetical protein
MNSAENPPWIVDCSVIGTASLRRSVAVLVDGKEREVQRDRRRRSRGMTMVLCWLTPPL